MPLVSKEYDYITHKIDAFRVSNPFFKEKTDAYVFSALCVKAQFYKNHEISLTDNDWEKIIVDGISDGGVDVLLEDPCSETCDLVIGQSKFYQTITFEIVLNALKKMVDFYKDMIKGHYENVNEKISKRFLSLNANIGQQSKVIFAFYTSAAKNRININRLTQKFYEQFTDTSNIELSVFFASDLVEEIKESESRRPTIERGKVHIDRIKNVLEYNNDAIIVNVSAMSIKELYATYGTSLLAKNLRYHIKTGTKIDNAIKDTINENPKSFWFKNNGVTIICDSFRVDGKEITLTNFSIINGGQTAYILYKSKNVNDTNDFYITCKIIQAVGNNEDEKNAYSLEIAKAANWQKPIKEIDLKANSPEQLRFIRAMKDVGIFYHTKRGEETPKEYKLPYLNADLAKIGKLCLCAIFQLPCKSRSQPSTVYEPKYYDIIFNRDQAQVAKICKELLYIYEYFDSTFIDKYDKENHNTPDSKERISFAHNARTICLAFVALIARYRQNNLKDQDIGLLAQEESTDAIYDTFTNISGIKTLFPELLFQQKDKYNLVLNRLFSIVISYGVMIYETAKDYDHALTASNFLKLDKNYHKILRLQWSNIKLEIKSVLDYIRTECL